MSRKNSLLMGIDIGSTKVNAVVGQRADNGLAVIGFGTHPSYGVKKGGIVNMDATTDSIRMAVDDAVRMADADMHTAVVGITGSHIKGFSSNGVIPINNDVKGHDIQRALEAAKSLVIPTDREVLHILPQEFFVDDQDGITNPVGMSGTRLEARTYIVTGAVASAHNIIRCANRNGIKVQDVILQQLASAESVLTEDEKELGCVLIDMGGGTTDIAVFYRGSIRYCAVLPIGGCHITQDIAIGLRTPMSEAEELKIVHGRAFTSPEAGDDESIEVSTIGEQTMRSVTKRNLTRIIAARVDETCALIRTEIINSGFKNLLAAGAVITGGSALLSGITTAASKIMNMPVRVGRPQNIEGISDIENPMFATGVGLLLFSTRCSNNIGNGTQHRFRNTVGHFKEWFTEAFL